MKKQIGKPTSYLFFVFLLIKNSAKNMENIMKKLIRPKKVQKGQRNYVTNEQFQDYAEQQFSNIYDYLEEDVLFDDSENKTVTLNFPVSLSNYDLLEIWYRVERDGYTIRGSQIIQKPVGSYFNINTLFRLTTTKFIGTTSLYRIGEKSISLETGGNYEFINGQAPSVNNQNTGFITRVIGRK